jgi:DNA-binding NtrC family response regulator
VDDDVTICDGIRMGLEPAYRVDTFPNAEDALQAMKGTRPDLVLLDIGLPGMNGVDALREIKRLHPDMLVVMITAYEDIKTAVSVMKLGAYDYVLKPLHMDTLELSIRNALSTIRLRKEIQQLQEQCINENLPCYLGESEEIQDVMAFVNKVAQSPDTPVLIFGETGTGKEIIARAIHFRSPNFAGPLVSVNCASIPKDLIESELFGYEKGAFTGARASGKKGLIEEAAGGTLFLDEVGDLSLEAQAKLLRFLEEGEFYRVGGTRKLKIKTRVVSATNRNLAKMIDSGLFRKDLYFRLGVIKVEIPSLNERPRDILPLSRFFLGEFARKFGKPFDGISSATEAALRNHQWQGNIRELRNVIERGVLIGQGPQLLVEDLGLPLAKDPPDEHTEAGPALPPSLPQAGIDLNALLESTERHYLQEALRIARGNESMAARLLRLNHHTFRYRRRKLIEK